MAEIITLIKESDFIIEESETAVFIKGTRFELPESLSESWSTKNLAIQAYDLTLTGDISAPGKKVSITSRYLRTKKALSISVSGEDGIQHPAPANSGRQPGAHGSEGLIGNNGSDAGQIIIKAEYIVTETLKLLAIGGKGAPGQNGGNGINGRNGSNTPDRKRSRRDEGNGRAGGTGQAGGNAGKGGNGGNGGKGGTGKIYSNNLVPGNIIIKVDGGSGGMGGSNGKPGNGGSGGRGGRGVNCERERYDRY